MDPHTYLTRQGWRGAGHALDPKGHGITKPLLVSQKRNSLGVGKKAHNAHADQWWSRAFDETLEALNNHGGPKDCSAATMAGHTKSSLPTDNTAMKGGLYSSFVKGQGLEGTIAGQECHARPSKKKRINIESRSRKHPNETLHISERSPTPTMASKDIFLPSQSTQTGTAMDHLNDDHVAGSAYTRPFAHSETHLEGESAEPNGAHIVREADGGSGGAEQHHGNDKEVQGHITTRQNRIPRMRDEHTTEGYDKKGSKGKTADPNRRKKKRRKDHLK
ncbi:MAG: hypothetical protein Q9222_001253 [Ikaeria aurantiellina]